MLLNGPVREVSLAADQATGGKFAARMIEGIKRVVNHTLERGIRDLSILGNALADAANCALEAVTNNMMIRKFASLTSEVGLPELAERVLESSGYRAYLDDGSPEGDERWRNVTELIGLSAEYRNIPAPEGLQQFLENIALIADVDTLDESASGVTLITLHDDVADGAEGVPT